ncbi:O-methyltransferase [Melanomma pulvis-pyrius CBS 109.77]|uniref:O-methyltransferase n=1 Tax=Melanomma pulvis-pyrius CBS 109.77 TaxID=1314802 RepID=A0A6A6XGL6_9PLEO|nr:O-methyltransferase [Melanomma pulvis-pyrius CBS 109.77]
MTPSFSFQLVLNQANHAGEEITRYLQSLEGASNGVVDDPFHPQSPVHVPIEIHRPRKRLVEAAARLLQLATDPKEYIEQLAANNQHLVCIRWLINLNILQNIPSYDSISYTELAALACVPEHQLKSVARMAAAHGFLHESSPSTLSHSRSSNLVATDPSFLNWARFLVNYSVPSAFRLSEATQRWGQTEKKSETAFNIAMDVKEPFFEHLRANEEMNAMFSSYMRNVASSDATGFSHLIAGFDWETLPPGATVVDVGGSGGHASVALASAFPNLNFIVQDLPETVANAEVAFAGNIEQNGSSVEKRLRFMAHDFFTPQPVTNADIYLLRMIIHDWPDEVAIKILGHIKDALKKPGARILVMDTILPQPGTVPLLQERQLRVRDLTMIQIFNAKEREYDVWKELMDNVGLRVINVRQPDGSNMGILEIIQRDINETEANNSGSLTPTPFLETQVGPGKDELPVLIIGAGISGLCLAQYLQKSSIPFLVLERDSNEQCRPQGYRLKLEADAADALRESLNPELYRTFEASCAVSAIGETDFDPISGACIKSRAGGGLAGHQGLRASYTVDRTVFRRILMTGVEDKIQFAREFASYTLQQENDESHLIAEFKDGSTIRGRFIVGADGTNSALRKQYLPGHKFLDTGAICIYGKTTMTPDLLQRYPARGLRWMTVCADTAPLIQSILIGDSPLTLLSEPIRFSSESRAQASVPMPEDYVYWVLIGRKELFADNDDDDDEAAGESNAASGKPQDSSAKASAAQSLRLTCEWHPALRSLFELQDVRQSSTMRVVSAPPKIPEWQPSPRVTLIGDAVHAMSPCGGVGANTALRDAAELGKLFADAGEGGELVQSVGHFEQGLRKRAFAGLMRSFVGSQRMFGQRPFEDLSVAEV